VSSIKQMSTICGRLVFFFSSRRRHTRFSRDWSSDVCSSDLHQQIYRELGRMTDAGWLLVEHEPAGTGRRKKTYPVLDTGREELRSEERRVGKESRWRGRTESW